MESRVIGINPLAKTKPMLHARSIKEKVHWVQNSKHKEERKKGKLSMRAFLLLISFLFASSAKLDIASLNLFALLGRNEGSRSCLDRHNQVSSNLINCSGKGIVLTKFPPSNQFRLCGSWCWKETILALQKGQDRGYSSHINAVGKLMGANRATQPSPVNVFCSLGREHISESIADVVPSVVPVPNTIAFPIDLGYLGLRYVQVP